MKISLCLVAILALPAFSMAEDKPISERASEAVTAAKQETKKLAHETADAAHHAWASAKAYLNPNPAQYRDSVRQKLDADAPQVEQLKNDAHALHGGRPYLSTRAKSLEEQLNYARKELGGIPDDPNTYPAARTHMNHTLDGLQAAMDELQNEVAADK